MSALYESLLAVQGEAPTIVKDATNRHFGNRYASLGAVHDAVLPLLSRHGLVWLTMPSQDERGEPTLDYRLVHAESGDVEAGSMPLMPAKRDPQALGSAITYARRYCLLAVLGFVADEDDDGNAASAPSAQRRPPTAKVVPDNGGERPASAKQRGLINARATDRGLGADQLADIVNHAGGGEPITWSSPDHAQSWLSRALDRLPARLVDDVLAGIEDAEVVAF